MSRGGAEHDEMAFLRRTTPEREELILRGEAPNGDAEVAEFALALRTLPVEPPAAVTAVIVPRLVEEARIGATDAAVPGLPLPDGNGNGAGPQGTAGAPTGRSRGRRRLALVARIAVAVAMLPLLMAGLAVAGVRLPDVAVDAFETVGVDLPNQAGSGDGGVEEAGAAGDDEADADGAGAGSKPAEPGSKGLSNADEKRGVGNGKGQGKVPPHAGDKGPPDHSNAGGGGAPGGPPDHSKSGGNRGGSSGESNAGGQGKSNAGGNSGGGGGPPPEPPGLGQANAPASPGTSGSGSGKTK